MACASAVAGHGALLVYGGLGRDGLSDQLWQCELSSGTWRPVRTRGEPPPPRAAHTAVVHGGGMFIFGGHGKSEAGGDTLLSDVHRLDLRDGTWEAYRLGSVTHRDAISARAAAPTAIEVVAPPARCSHAAVAIGGVMYIFGGECIKLAAAHPADADDDGADADAEDGESERDTLPSGIVDDETTDDETSRARRARRARARRGTGRRATPRELDTKFEMLGDLFALPLDGTGAWRQVHPSGRGPSPRSGAAAAAIGGRLFIYGGWDDNKVELDDLWEYRVRTAVWSLLPPLAAAAPRARTCACLVPIPSQNRLILYGGCDAKAQYGELYEYRLPPRSRRGGGGEESPPATERSAIIGQTGGGTTERRRADGARGWRCIEMVGAPPPARSNHCAVAQGGKLVVFGGFDGKGFLSDLHTGLLEPPQ